MNYIVVELYSTTVDVSTQLKKNSRKRKPRTITMPAQPANPQPTEDVRISRKRQAPLNANCEPVTIPVPKKKKAASEQTRKKTAPAKPGLQKMTVVPEKLAPAKRKPSVKIEEVPDEDNSICSEAPRNPRNILEAAE